MSSGFNESCLPNNLSLVCGLPAIPMIWKKTDFLELVDLFPYNHFLLQVRVQPLFGAFSGWHNLEWVVDLFQILCVVTPDAIPFTSTGFNESWPPNNLSLVYGLLSKGGYSMLMSKFIFAVLLPCMCLMSVGGLSTVNWLQVGFSGSKIVLAYSQRFQVDAWVIQQVIKIIQ